MASRIDLQNSATNTNITDNGNNEIGAEDVRNQFEAERNSAFNLDDDDAYAVPFSSSNYVAENVGAALEEVVQYGYGDINLTDDGEKVSITSSFSNRKFSVFISLDVESTVSVNSATDGFQENYVNGLSVGRTGYFHIAVGSLPALNHRLINYVQVGTITEGSAGLTIPLYFTWDSGKLIEFQLDSNGDYDLDTYSRDATSDNDGYKMKYKATVNGIERRYTDSFLDAPESGFVVPPNQ